MVRVTGKIHLIAGFKTQTDQAEMPFHAYSRIKSATDIVGTKIVYGTCEPGERRWPGIKPEIDESSLHAEERSNRVMPSDEFEARQPMQNFEIAGCYG